MISSKPFGSWNSPLSSELISSSAMRLCEPRFHREWLYWIETRPAEAGRNAIVRQRPGGEREECLAPTFNARTRVHEYGGGSYAIADEGLFFIQDKDQRLYHLSPGANAKALTPAAPFRYADFLVDSKRQQLIGVWEDHTSAKEATNRIFSLPLTGGTPVALIEGRDFYSSPTLSPDGKSLAWLEWSHPDMPWDSAELWIGTFSANGIENRRRIAGSKEEMVFQPCFSPMGVLHFISDRTGWGNLYRWENGTTTPMTQLEEEFGAPLWVFGQSTYAFLTSGEIIARYGAPKGHRLAKISKTRLEPLGIEGSEIGYVRSDGKSAAYIAGTSESFASLWRWDFSGRPEEVQRSAAVPIDTSYFSIPSPVEFPTSGGLIAHAHYYPPHNPDFQAPPGELPPCLVVCHGGPTANSTSTLSLGIQYWTTRGFAVIDVNYGGSTGLGRAYRERLREKWGIVDVEDCKNAALFLARKKLVDEKRLAIRGSSAGGYTTLCALTFHDTFRAGASYYGISDLKALLQDTHKFESRYDRFLIGPFDEDLYRARSPLFHLEALRSSIIFFQGLEDRVVPPAQAEIMVAALKKKGIAVAYVTFADEQHGFRKSENIKRALDAELYFYSRVFGFPLFTPVSDIPIWNLASPTHR